MKTSASTAVVPRTAADLVPMREVGRSATAAVQQLLAKIGDGTVSERAVKRVRRVSTELATIVHDVVRIADCGEQLARSSAEVHRDIERIATEIDDFQTKRAENAAKRAAAKVLANKGAQVQDAQLDVQLLTAQLQRDDLRAQLQARKAVRKDAKAEAKRAAATPPPVVDRVQAAKTARAEAARQKNEGDAARIVRDVQIGAVAADEQHPYHAFAACVYLAGKLEDGLTSANAAERAREAVLALMLDADVSPEQIAAYHTAYLELKDRAAAAAKRREATELFEAAEAFAGGVQ
jgi:hypothetical protein